MEALAWAHEQFWGTSIPDIRLQRRLVEVAACIREHPCGTLPRALREPAVLKAAYRMLSHPDVTHERIVQPHVAATRARCREAGEYLLIEDTTALSFSQRRPLQGMGPLTQKQTQGFLAHTNLAVRVDHWSAAHEPQVLVVGLFGQICWARERPQGTREARKKAKRTGAPSESDRWAQAVGDAGRPPPGVRWTLVADREGDIFDVIARCAAQGVDWILRAAQDRTTSPSLVGVFEAAAHAPLLGRFRLRLRARPGVPARTAHLELRAVGTSLAPPHDRRNAHMPQPVGLVEVREIDPPPGVEAVHWVLLTSWPCETFAQARRGVAAYACRWLIEEYHKALKTGTHIEESQLATEGRIEALLGIHAVVAADLLRLKLLARTLPDEPLAPDLLSPEALVVLEIQFGRPDSGWTNACAMRAIARMGGYLGRTHDGPPGWLSIWRGWFRLMLMTDGYILALQHQTYG